MPKARSAVQNVWSPANPSFSTSFPSIQNPIGSPWVNTQSPGNGMTRMQVGATGKCYGTNTGSTFDDSYAYVRGFENFRRYKIIAVLGLAPSLPNDGNSREMELHAMVNSETSSGIKLLETDLQYNTTIVPFVRWEGTTGSFTVASGSFTLASLPATGDIIELDIDPTTATAALIQNSQNCGTINWATDANLSGGQLYTRGTAGIGAFIRPGANNSDFYYQSVNIQTY